MEEGKEDVLKLGGNIQLTGFSGLDGGEMVVVKKMIGNYAKELSEKCSKFENLGVTMKHESDSYNLNAICVNDGKEMTSDASEKNIYLAIDSALKKLISNA